MNFAWTRETWKLAATEVRGGMLAKTLAVIASALILAPGAAAKVLVGDVPPPLLGTDQNGDRADLSQMSGKIVVVTFWPVWYRPAHKFLPALEAIQNSVGEERLEVIAVTSEDRRTYRSVARRLKDYRMTLVHDRRGHVRGYYGRGWAYTVIVGTDGRIVSVKGYHNENLRRSIIDELNSLLRAPSSA